MLGKGARRPRRLMAERRREGPAQRPERDLGALQLVILILAILIFNFFPVVVIFVILAMRNDCSILSITYGNVQYKQQPEAWNMRLVLRMAAVLGLVRPIAAFGCSTWATGFSTSVIRTSRR